MKLKTLGFVAIAAVAFAVPASAQRFLTYDTDRAISVMGTVVGIDWMNPNSELHVLVRNMGMDKDGEWVFLMGPPTRSTQYGWNPDSLKFGEPVSLMMHPAKDGSHSGQLVSATLPDGRVLQASEPDEAG